MFPKTKFEASKIVATEFFDLLKSAKIDFRVVEKNAKFPNCRLPQ